MIISFDIESTGTSPQKDKIVSISAIKLDKDFNILERKSLILNPLIPIPKEASDIHGITDEMVKDKHPFQKYAKSMYEYFNDEIEYLAGYNIKRFDIPLLIEEFARCGFVYTPPKVLDAYKVFAKKEKRDLTAAYKFYTGLDIDGAHDADVDNNATIEVLKGQIFMYGLDLEEVSNLCPNDTIDFAGKLILVDNVPCYNFGKHNGKPVLSEREYAKWMLNGDFSTETKNILKSILNNTYKCI